MPGRFHVDQEVGDALVLWRVGVGAGQAHAPVASCAADVHTFCPVSCQPPSARTALVRNAARSEPAPGSLNSWHQINSPRSVRGTNCSICSGCRARGSSAPPTSRSPGRDAPRPPPPAPGRSAAARPGPPPGRTAAASAAPTDPSRRARPVASPRAARRCRRPQRRSRARMSATAAKSMCSSRRTPCCVSAAHPAQPARPSAQELRDAVRPPQVQVRVVFPGDADTAEHLDAVLGVGLRGLDAHRRPPAPPRSTSWSSSASAAARAASAAATDVCSERSSISAHMCLMAWKLPIGLPNCSRTFAYSVAVCSSQRASPAASAASTVAARSTTRCAGTVSSSAAASSSTTRASGREKSVASSDSTVTPSAAPSTSSQLLTRRAAATPRCPRRRRGRTAPCPRRGRPRRTARRSARPRRCARPDASASSSSACEPSSTRVASAVVATGPGTSAAAASSTIAHRSATVPPAPPCSSGSATPKIPSWARPRVRRPPRVRLALFDVPRGIHRSRSRRPSYGPVRARRTARR